MRCAISNVRVLSLIRLGSFVVMRGWFVPNLLDYVRSITPDDELAERIERVLKERGRIRL